MTEIITLTEHQSTPEPIPLTVHERDQLTAALPHASISPAHGHSDRYTINPHGYIGLINTGEHIIHIAPKIGIERALFLITYALDPKRWSDATTPASDELLLNEAIAIPLLHRTREAVRRQLLHGYHSTDDTLHGLRGRIRFNDQLRRHQRLSVPLEVTYDEHTPDINENRLLLAALHRIRQLHRLPSQLQREAHQLIRSFDGVSHIRYHPQQIPQIRYNRLNQHYAPALTLARLVLTDRSLELAPGANASNSLLFDMANVFETFVHTSLKEALKLRSHDFPRGNRPRLHLDNDQRVPLKPDISWWQHGTCILIGDIKYKKTISGDGNNADLYQALAYAHAAQLPAVTLIYAHTEATTATHTTPDGTRIHIEALDLTGTPHQILNEIDNIADRLRNRRAALRAAS